MDKIKSEVKIADDVISEIAGIATMSVQGVLSVGEGLKKNSRKAIEIKKDGDGELIAFVPLTISVGVSVKKVCAEVQEKIREAILSMLDLTVKNINIYVLKVEED